VVIRRHGGVLSAWRHREGIVAYAPAEGWITRSGEGALGPPGAPHRLSELVAARRIRGLDDAIDDALKAAMGMAAGHLGAEVTLAAADCSELLGVDFVVDGAGRPWLLEFNRKPATEAREAAEDELRRSVLRGSLICAGARTGDNPYRPLGRWRLRP